MDAGFTTTCTKSAALLSALVADNEISLTTRVMPDKCSTLRPVPTFNIEHFHSVTRRVNWGGGGLGRALLLQEHRIRGPLCGDIRTALARGGVDHFDCSALWGSETIGLDHRETFLAKRLNMSVDVLRSVEGQHLGVGALFTAVFQRYDLLLVWHETNGTVQRLANALATGVPVIAKASREGVAAFGKHPGVLFADNLHALTRHARALNVSSALRAASSDAGVAAAADFSREAIAERYKLVVAAARRRMPYCGRWRTDHPRVGAG
jgi:hypothetical protein